MTVLVFSALELQLMLNLEQLSPSLFTYIIESSNVRLQKQTNFLHVCSGGHSGKFKKPKEKSHLLIQCNIQFYLSILLNYFSQMWKRGVGHQIFLNFINLHCPKTNGILIQFGHICVYNTLVTLFPASCLTAQQMHFSNVCQLLFTV